MKKLILIALVPLAALAQWTSTRTTTYDYQCQDSAGVKISDHQRADSAFQACSNLSLKDGKTRYVQGGRWRVTAASSSSSSSSVSSSSASSSSATTGTASLNWLAPTKNTDGSALTNLAGYTVYYGTSPTTLSQSASTNATSYVVSGLQTGRTWYFAVAAVNTAGVISPLSVVASKAL